MPQENIFSNCSVHYAIEQYFLNCTNTTRPCELLRDLHTVSQLLEVFDYYVSSVLFSLAFVVNVYFLSLIAPLLLRMSSEVRKRYVFLLSRCISSISAAITLLILRCILYVYLPPGSTSCFYLYAFVMITDNISFYSLQGMMQCLSTVNPKSFQVRTLAWQFFCTLVSFTPSTSQPV